MKWLLILGAILLEVLGTVMMRLSEGFAKPVYTIGVFICYGGSLTLLIFSLKYFQMSIVYAMWSGLGIAIIAVVELIYFKEKIDILKAISLLLIVLGVIGLNLSRK